MCGIAGAIGFSREEGEACVRAMNAALARRGPDAEGIEAFHGAVLGHRRLSIFDLSEAGRQPMSTPDRQISVVFNGAIYNFKRLRQELESRGCRFRTKTDTEVLLHGYREWGIDELVRRLHGMFAFGLWDDAARRLFLVRDRLGVKPLLYCSARDGILFASTARAIRCSGLAGALDPQSMAEFLEFGYVTDARAIYQSVWKVPAASILEWHSGQFTSRVYWTPAEITGARPVPFEQAVEETEQRFYEAVTMRLDADVPVGTLLSGGVDSSLVCWAVAKSGADITAFTIGTPGECDEAGDARRTAKVLGIRHQVIDLSPEETPSLDHMTSAYGEPFACSSALGMLRVSSAVKSSATVLLTGDGGDDVFLGYPEHGHFYHAQRLAPWLPHGAGSLVQGLSHVVPETGAARRALHFLEYATSGLGAVTRAHPGLNVYRRHRMLGPALAEARLPQREIELSRLSARNLLTEFLGYDRNNRFTGEYLTKIDGATMYHALEGRSPFLDQDLWNFAAALPYEVRLHNGALKAVLREIARRRVSPAVATGRKRGFSIPANRWLVSRWREEFEDLFASSVLDRSGWISAPAVLNQYRRAVKTGDASNQLWYVYILERWARREANGSYPQSGTAAAKLSSSAPARS